MGPGSFTGEAWVRVKQVQQTFLPRLPRIAHATGRQQTPAARLGAALAVGAAGQRRCSFALLQHCRSSALLHCCPGRLQVQTLDLQAVTGRLQQERWRAEQDNML